MPRTIRTIIEDREPLTAPAQMTVGEAARLMKQSQYSAVMVVEDGKLAECGTHKELLARHDGIYRRLYELQLQLQ